MRRATRPMLWSGGGDRAGVLGLDAFLEHRERLGAQLRHPGLGHAEEAGQLLGGAALEEVADDHQAVALGQQVHGVTQVGVQLTGLELLERLDRAAVGEHVDEGEVLVGASLTSCSRASTTERNMRSCSRLSSSRVMPRASAISTLLGTRPSSVARRCSTASSLRASVAHRAGRPVGGPDGVEDRAPDALGGEAVERHASGLVVAAGRLDQTEGAGPGQLVAVDVAGEVHRHLEHDVLHQRQVLLDQTGQFLRLGLGACSWHRPPFDHEPLLRLQRSANFRVRRVDFMKQHRCNSRDVTRRAKTGSSGPGSHTADGSGQTAQTGSGSGVAAGRPRHAPRGGAARTGTAPDRPARPGRRRRRGSARPWVGHTWP